MQNLDFLQYQRISNIDDVVERFQALENRLKQSDEYKLLHNFNKTYLIITQNVRQRMQQAAFEHPQFLNYFDAHFAKYYLEALDNYLKNKPTPPAWRRAFEACKTSECSPLILMSLGVNAHVNNDIAQVLRDCRAEKKHYKDYKKINKIIKSSIHEVIDNLDDDPALLSPKRSILKPFYKITMSILIRFWRHNAWRNYKKISRQDKTVKNLEKEAADSSRKLSRLPL